MILQFIAHIGYHIVIDKKDEPHLGDDSGLTFMFTQDGMLYMKNDLMRKYDSEVRTQRLKLIAKQNELV